jgi:hypothetical protein
MECTFSEERKSMASFGSNAHTYTGLCEMKRRASGEWKIEYVLRRNVPTLLGQATRE